MRKILIMKKKTPVLCIVFMSVRAMIILAFTTYPNFLESKNALNLLHSLLLILLYYEGFKHFYDDTGPLPCKNQSNHPRTSFVKMKDLELLFFYKSTLSKKGNIISMLSNCFLHVLRSRGRMTFWYILQIGLPTSILYNYNSLNFQTSSQRIMNSNQQGLKSSVSRTDYRNQQALDSLSQYELIDQYLNLDPVYSNQPRSEAHENAKCNVLSESSNKNVPVVPKRKISVLHNFQKHLLTLIKKFIHFPKNMLVTQPSGDISYALWLSFLESNTISKRTLNLVFGVAQINQRKRQMIKLSKQSSTFMKLYSIYSLQQLCEAQKLLRERVVMQANTLTKNFLKSNSSVGRFEQFYLYFRTFITQLENGPLLRRMSKSIKQKMQMRRLQTAKELEMVD